MKPLCYAPFIGMYATSYGSFAPCCTSDKFKFNSPEEYWNSDQLKSIRELMLAGQWPEHCSTCKLQTEAGLFSDRDLYDRLYEDVGRPESTSDGPVVFDFRPGNRCNLKCRMCSPHGSDLIEKEVAANPSLVKYVQIENENKNIVHLSEYAQSINIKWLKVLGGEPTIDPDVYDLLKSLVDSNKTDMTVMITTNATNHNDKFYSLLKQFKSVTLKFSIDGAGPAYEYIRTNANWSKTSKVVETLLNESTFNKYIISPVLQPYNLPSFTTFLDWLKYLHANYKFIVSYHHSDDIKTHISALRPNDLEVCKQRVINWAADKDQKLLRDLNFNSLIKLLNVESDQRATDRFVKYNNILDKIRNTSIDYEPMLSSYK